MCKKIPPARSELGCRQFLSVTVEDSVLWPPGEAWIRGSACPCKFLPTIIAETFFSQYIVCFFASPSLLLHLLHDFHTITNIFVFFRPIWRCWSYTARQTRLWLLWVKSFGIQHFPLRLTQKGIFWSDKCPYHPAKVVQNVCVPIAALTVVFLQDHIRQRIRGDGSHLPRLP